ncbi:sugar phosphate isomerase/epimerase family protein [Paenibacillus sp. GYB003]|uniref:sugar phosphate isomerase/epimerase family protein n=1 Tax=Paenibacillus sp. GYB003 TaxID=2994392 RepID=UPI002F96C5FA
MRPLYSLFPKMLAGVSPGELAALLHETGFDCVDLVVRDGYWVTPDGLAREAPAFVRGMQSRGVRVRFATTPYTPGMLAENAEPLAVMADLGIEAFRMGYFPYEPSLPLADQLNDARRQMEKLAGLCEAHRLKAVYQVHHGYSQLIQHSVSALAAVRGLPPEHVGVMLDPGNQFHEGREHFGKALDTLGDHVAAVGVKDVVWKRDPDGRHAPNKGWSAAWGPCDEGVLNWHEIGASLRKLDRPVVVNVQPFYHPQDKKRHIEALKREFAYIRQAFGEAEGSHEHA